MVEFLSQQVPVLHMLAPLGHALRRGTASSGQPPELALGLDDIVVEAGLERADSQIFIPGSSEHHRRAVWVGGTGGGEDLEAIGPAQAVIRDQEARRRRRKRLIQSGPVRDFCDVCLGAEFLAQDASRQSADIRVVVGKEDPHPGQLAEAKKD